MADLYGTNNDRSFSSSSLESEDMSSFLQSFLNNSSTNGNSFYSTEGNQVNFSPRNDVAGFDLGCQVQKLSERRQNSNPPRSSKRTRAAEIHNLSEKRRRSRINEKLKALQTLVPNSNKTDKASMLDEAIEYLKQLQLKVQTLTMRNGMGLQPSIYSQEEEMARGMGMGYDEGYKLPNPSEGGGFSISREFDAPNHIGMMKQDTIFGAEVANKNQYVFTNHSTSTKVERPNRPSIDIAVAFSGRIPSHG